MKFLNFLMDKDNKLKVFLTDDHNILLNGLVGILASKDDIEVIGTANSVAETLEKLTRVTPDILVTDYNLPDDDGLSLIRKVKAKYPTIKQIVLSMHDESHLVKEILREGVSGYLLKKDSDEELVNALRSVKNGKTYLSSDINSLLMKELHGPQDERLLTDREREILKLISKELTNRQIAEELFISERTVETHRKNIFRKTGTNNLVGLIKFAYANNLI